MSFLEHLDEFVAVWSVRSSLSSSQPPSRGSSPARSTAFLAAPVERALAEAQRQQVPIAGYSGNETIATITSLKENDSGRYVFAEETKLGTSLIPAGASVMARVYERRPRQAGVFTDEALYSGNAVIPKGVRLPTDLSARGRDVFRH